MNRLLLIILIVPCLLNAQERHQERAAFLYNISLGGFTSAIGSVINKPKGSDWKKAFLRGLWQGGVGGLVDYSGKKTLGLINSDQKIIYALPATIIHSAGTSIIENAALNEPFLQNWNFAYGFVRIDFSLKHKKEIKIRLLPESVYATIINQRLGKFDVLTSLLTGTIVFKNPNFFIELNGQDYLGYSLGRSFVYVNNYTNNKFHTIAHELVHIFQYKEFQVLNTWVKPLEKKIKSPQLQTLFSKYIYFDMPYAFGLYELEGRFKSPRYYRNFFEFEAEHFSTNSYVPLN